MVLESLERVRPRVPKRDVEHRLALASVTPVLTDVAGQGPSEIVALCQNARLNLRFSLENLPFGWRPRPLSIQAGRDDDGSELVNSDDRERRISRRRR